MKPGKVVTKTKLHKVYWRGVSVELRQLGYVLRAPKTKKGEVAKFEVLGLLPEKEDLLKEVNEKLYTRSVETWFDEAKSEVECLRDEMEEWRSGMECNEGLQATETYQRVEEAEDALANVDMDSIEIPDDLTGKKLFIPPMCFPVSNPHRFSRPRTGRDARLGEVNSILGAVKDRVQEEVDELTCAVDAIDEGEVPEEGRHEAEEKVSVLEGLVSEIEDAVDELENVEFPGLYG